METEGQWELRIGGEQTQAAWENFNRNEDQHWDEIEEEIFRSRVKVINRSRVFTHTVPKERVEDAVAVVEEPSQVINRSRVKVINRRLCLPTQLEDIREDDERQDSPHDFVMVDLRCRSRGTSQTRTRKPTRRRSHSSATFMSEQLHKCGTVSNY